MVTRRLGSAGPELTGVGFGAWAVGGPFQYGWGPVEDDDSVAAIRRAVDGGANWVDTAAVYGLGHSEEVVGRALEPYRTNDDVLIFTKCGRSWYESDGAEIVTDLRPESIRFECEQSLRRLGVERIDLYQFHRHDDRTGTPVEESWGTMAELVDEGKVRWIGVSNFTVELLERCEATRHVDSLQPPLSLLRPESSHELIPWCREHGTGVIAYSPMESGLLTGAFSRERLASLDPGDWRLSPTHPAAFVFREPYLGKALDLVERLRPLADRHGVSVGAVAVAWVRSVPGVTAAIVGARRPEQVDGWLPAGKLELSAEDLAQVGAALR
jgi:aryl-alcohol dehydrogenase-like predicted oxidoreductase